MNAGRLAAALVLVGMCVGIRTARAADGVLHLGARVGSERSTVTELGDLAIVQPQAGILMDLGQDGVFGLRSGIEWSRRGAIARLSNAADNGVYCDRQQTELDVITVPMLLRVSPSFDQAVGPTLLGGLAVSDAVRQCATCLEGDGPDFTDPEAQRWSAYVVVGFEIEARVAGSTFGASLRSGWDLYTPPSWFTTGRAHVLDLALEWWPGWRTPRRPRWRERGV